MTLAIHVGCLLLWGLATYLGYRRGCLSSVRGLLRLTATVGVPLLLARPVASHIGERYLYPLVYSRVSTTLTGAISKAEIATEEGISRLTASLPFILRPYITVTPSLPLADTVDSWARTAASGITDAAALVFSCVLLLIIGYLVATLLLHLAEQIIRLPVLRTADRILGLIAGSVTGLFLVTLVMTLRTHLGF